MSLIVTPMSLEAALQSLDPFNNPHAQAHFEHKLFKRLHQRSA